MLFLLECVHLILVILYSNNYRINRKKLLKFYILIIKADLKKLVIQRLKTIDFILTLEYKLEYFCNMFCRSVRIL